MPNHSPGLAFDRNAQIAVYAKLRKPFAVRWENLADIACERRNLAFVHKLARRPFQRVGQTLLESTFDPKGQHAAGHVVIQSAGESRMRVQRPGEVSDDLLEEGLAKFTGDTFLDSAK